MVGDGTQTGSASDNRPDGWAYAGFPFPVVWLALVAASALIGGIALGLLAPEELRPLVVGSAVAGLLLGVVGGALSLNPAETAWMGTAVWSVVLPISYAVSYTRASLPEEEMGGLGLVIGFVFVITVVPLFAGALLGGALRRSPLATSAIVLGGAGFLTCGLWLMFKLLNLS